MDVSLVVPQGESLAYRVTITMTQRSALSREHTLTYFLEHSAYEAYAESPLVVREGETTNASMRGLPPADSVDAFLRRAFPTPRGSIGEEQVNQAWSPGMSPSAEGEVFRDSFLLREQDGRFVLRIRRFEGYGQGMGSGVGRHVWDPAGRYSLMQEEIRGAGVTLTIVKTLDRDASRARSAFLRRVGLAQRRARESFDLESVPSPEAEVLSALSSMDQETLVFHLFGRLVQTLSQIGELEEPLRRAFFESDLLDDASWSPALLAPLQNIADESPSAAHFLETLPAFDVEALRATPVTDPDLVERATNVLYAYESMRDPVPLVEVLVEKLEAFPEGTRGKALMAELLATFTCQSFGEDVSAWRTFLREHRDRPFVDWLVEVARGNSFETAVQAMRHLTLLLMIEETPPSDAIREVALARAQSRLPLVRTMAAQLLLRLGDSRGIPQTIHALRGPYQTRAIAFVNLSIIAPSTFGFRPAGPEMERAVALTRIEAWARSLQEPSAP